MRVRSKKYCYHLGQLWHVGEEGEYPGDNPPGKLFDVLGEKEKVDKEAEELPGEEVSKVEETETEKELLVKEAVNLGMGSPSTLSRWSKDRLKKGIEERETVGEDEAGAEEVE